MCISNQLIYFIKSKSNMKNPTPKLKFDFLEGALDECFRRTCRPRSSGWEPLLQPKWYYEPLQKYGFDLQK